MTPQAKWLSHDHEERLLSKKDMRFPAPAGAFRHQVLIQDDNKEHGYQNEYWVKFVGAALILRAPTMLVKLSPARSFLDVGL